METTCLLLCSFTENIDELKKILKSFNVEVNLCHTTFQLHNKLKGKNDFALISAKRLPDTYEQTSFSEVNYIKDILEKNSIRFLRIDNTEIKKEIIQNFLKEQNSKKFEYSLPERQVSDDFDHLDGC